MDDVETAEYPVDDLAEIGLLWIGVADQEAVNELRRQAKACRVEADGYRSLGGDSYADQAESDAERWERMADLIERHLDAT